MMNKRHFLRATAVAASLLSLGSAAQAAPDWLPNKPVTLVVGHAAPDGVLGALSWLN